MFAPPIAPDFRVRTSRNLLFDHRYFLPYVSEDPALGEVLALLSDEYARAILAATSERPMSAKEIATHCDMSEPTVYRRVERLQEHDLVAKRTQIETDGNDYSVYAATLSGFSVDLTDGTFDSTVERVSEPAFPGQNEDDTADRFKKMWENL